MTDITYGGAPRGKTAVALGYFDGLHLGHVGVIKAALSQDGLRPAVFTFNCDTTLPKFYNPENIITFETKCELLEKLGVEYVYAPDFAEVCGLSAEEFVGEILIKKLNAGFACCGTNFRFGKGGTATPEMLCELGARYGMRVQTVPDVCSDGVMISSTRIRELIRSGEIAEANKLLGYDLWYRLTVVRGNSLGRKLSFPTINQIIPETNVIPRFGVYSSFAEVNGTLYRGVTNIGVKPTVERHDGTGVVMETHIIGFDGCLYGEKIAVALRRFIRPERKFAGLEELKAQIAADKEAVMNLD